MILVDGITRPDDQGTNDDEVGPNYFSTIGVPLVLGREINAQDFSSAAHVAVVNETFAKFYFNGRNPLGHKIYMQDSDHPNQPPYEIIGVARDVRDHYAFMQKPVPRRMYAPLTSGQFDDAGAPNFELRAAGNPQALINSVRNAVRELNPNLIIDNVETAGDLVNDSLNSQILVAKLSAFFGALVLVLVCVGLYGSMAYNVAARTREIGVRMALGAPRGNVIWMVTRQAWMVLAFGFAVGVPAGVAATRLFKTMLFGVGQADPVSIGSAILTLVAICLAAAVVPVRRATKVDPLVALRYE
jgi:predicted permease